MEKYIVEQNKKSKGWLISRQFEIMMEEQKKEKLNGN